MAVLDLPFVERLAAPSARLADLIKFSLKNPDASSAFPWLAGAR